MSIYDQLKAAGIPLDNHESDLYALVTPESTEIIRGYQFKNQVHIFVSEIDKKRWFDIPFAFTPFWAAKAK